MRQYLMRATRGRCCMVPSRSIDFTRRDAAATDRDPNCFRSESLRDWPAKSEPSLIATPDQQFADTDLAERGLLDVVC